MIIIISCSPDSSHNCLKLEVTSCFFRPTVQNPKIFSFQSHKAKTRHIGVDETTDYVSVDQRIDYSTHPLSSKSDRALISRRVCGGVFGLSTLAVDGKMATWGQKGVSKSPFYTSDPVRMLPHLILSRQVHPLTVPALSQSQASLRPSALFIHKHRLRLSVS